MLAGHRSFSLALGLRLAVMTGLSLAGVGGYALLLSQGAWAELESSCLVIRTPLRACLAEAAKGALAVAAMDVSVYDVV